MQVHNKMVVTTAVIAFLLVFYEGTYALEWKNNPVGFDLQRLQKEIKPLKLDAGQIFSDEEISFFNYYGLVNDHKIHAFGAFQSNGHSIVTHVIKPFGEAKGTVFLIHGYNDHSGIMRNVISSLFLAGFNVVAFDLPGHGLSSGHRSFIDDFFDYAQVLDDFINRNRNFLNEPYLAVGHSLGCSVIIEYLTKFRNNSIIKSIFIAPLVRPAYWQFRNITFLLKIVGIQTIPRKKKQDSADPLFVKFSLNDPLQNRQIDLHWIDALENWNQRIKEYNAIQTPILVIQGKSDKVVDWDYNLQVLKKLFPKMEMLLIANGSHQLHNDREQIRDHVFDRINAYLKKP